MSIATEITDARLDVIAHAREVLERAVSECNSGGCKKPLTRVTFAMAALEGTLRAWSRAGDGEEKDAAVRMAAHWSVRLVAIVGDVMGPDAASYVSCGEEGAA